MITYVEVDTERLNRDIQELNESLAKVQGSLVSMMEEIEEMNGMWTGRANLAFRLQVNRDRELMEALISETRHLSECMAYAGNEYVRCENDVKSAVEAIRI